MRVLVISSGKAGFPLIRRSHQVEYLIVELRYSLLNDRVIGFYNTEVITEEPNIKCTWWS
jgi:hypothetical protein